MTMLLVPRMSTERPRTTPEKEGDVAVTERPRVDTPRRWHVVFHNDDYTTMEFVVHVLMKLFGKSETEATYIMLSVHRKGYGIVGTYTRDVAETKAEETVLFAREHGHPLRATAEPEGFGESDGAR